MSMHSSVKDVHAPCREGERMELAELRRQIQVGIDQADRGELHDAGWYSTTYVGG